MAETYELRDLEHTLADHYDQKVNDSLVSTKALVKMETSTQRQLSAQGIGPYQRAYMQRSASWLQCHEQKYNRCLAENEELRDELRKIKRIIDDLSAHLEERQH